MGVSASKSGFVFEIPNEYNNKEIGNKLEDFELLEKIGAGGYGYAIKVRSLKNFKIYVIKRGIELTNEDKREIIVLNKLDHPNICKCLSCFKENGLNYILMDLYNNKDLYRYENAFSNLGKHIKEESIWNIFYQCLEALTYIHGKGYIHRDIKLANIFMDENEKIVIGDFGLCAMFNQKEFSKLNNDEKRLLEFSASSCGTDRYMAPEVMIKGQVYDQRADVFSMGVCFYGLLYHQYPVITKTNNGKFVFDCIYKSVLKNDTNYDYELRYIIYNMLNIDPNKRPDSSEVFKYFTKQYIKKYVANTSVCSVVQCLFSFPNFFNYFSNNILIMIASETPYAKEIFFLLNSIKISTDNNSNNLDELLKNAYILKKNIISGEKSKIKDNVELSPVEVINYILNALYYELNIISPIKEANHQGLVDIFSDFNTFVNYFKERFSSIISKNFTGVLKKTLKCQGNNCKGENITFQKFNFVNFNIKNYMSIFNQNFPININSLFKYYNSTYSSYKYNEYVICKTCLRMTKHSQNKKFYVLPKNLIIYLDKSQCKSNINIDFDEKLIINDELKKNNPYNYYLVGIICEIKDMYNGKIKYASFIKNGNNWINCDNQSNNRGKFTNFAEIKKYGSIISLFYYDENRTHTMEEESNNSLNNSINNNYSINQQYQNSNQQSNNEAWKQYVFSNLYNNTIPYNNNVNNNAFIWQKMCAQPNVINNNNNFPNNQFNNNAGNVMMNNNQGINNSNMNMNMPNNLNMNNNGMMNNNYGYM